MAINAPPLSAAAAWAQANGLEVVGDDGVGERGPLFGILAGLRWMRAREMDLLITAPCDLPRLPDDFVARLANGAASAPGAVACDADGQLHPLCALWRPQSEQPLRIAAVSGRHPPLRDLLHNLGFTTAEFAEEGAFANVNTARDLEAVQIGSGGAGNP
jgi:molybdopterin-guanine dinucleotide biosynthesis protein A